MESGRQVAKFWQAFGKSEVYKYKEEGAVYEIKKMKNCERSVRNDRQCVRDRRSSGKMTMNRMMGDDEGNRWKLDLQKGRSRGDTGKNPCGELKCREKNEVWFFRSPSFAPTLYAFLEPRLRSSVSCVGLGEEMT